MATLFNNSSICLALCKEIVFLIYEQIPNNKQIFGPQNHALRKKKQRKSIHALLGKLDRPNDLNLVGTAMGTLLGNLV